MPENKVYTAIGLMSGTSLDGIDVALVRTDGHEHIEMLDFQEFPYDVATQNTLKNAFGSRVASDITHKAEDTLTQAHIDAVEAFIVDTGCEADLIGFHGQTIFHDPAQKFTWQIGDSTKLASETGIDVIGDMRVADVEAGGQGAPLLPICHRAFASNIEKPIAILNLGGVGNITWLGREYEDILAFDTGPANALIDDLVKAHTDQQYDRDGELAKAGQANEAVVNKWMQSEYFKKPAPKSLDRDEWDVSEVYDLKLEDAIATLSEFTIKSIKKSCELLPNNPRALYVTGGGRHNKYMMERLRAELNFTIEDIGVLGWNGDALEAQGFAYLAVRSLLGLSLSEPMTTGVPTPMTGGKIYKAL